nr:deacetylase [Cryptococcus depauperatus CBS 7841]
MYFSSILVILAVSSTAIAGPLVAKRDTLEIINNCSVQGTMALTFDGKGLDCVTEKLDVERQQDGPYIYEQQVSDVLEGSKGTFFFNGNNYVCIYDRVDEIRSLFAAGHTIGSHTWDHPDLTKLSESDIHSELSKLEEAFIRILGLKPLYFRPPYGSINDNVLNVLRARGYKKVILWSDDTGDSLGQPPSYSEELLETVAGDYPNPHLVLAHSTISTTPSEVILQSAPKLKGAGYQLMTVNDCIGDSDYPYEIVGQPGIKDQTWTC